MKVMTAILRACEKIPSQLRVSMNVSGGVAGPSISGHVELAALPNIGAPAPCQTRSETPSPRARVFSQVLSMILLMAAGGIAMAEGDADAGKAKAAACSACHGSNGISTNPIYPNLAGQHPQYLNMAMKAYQSGERGNPIMKAMAAPLSDEDIANLSAYFSAQSCQ